MTAELTLAQTCVPLIEGLKRFQVIMKNSPLRYNIDQYINTFDNIRKIALNLISDINIIKEHNPCVKDSIIITNHLTVTSPNSPLVNKFYTSIPKETHHFAPLENKDARHCINVNLLHNKFGVAKRRIGTSDFRVLLGQDRKLYYYDEDEKVAKFYVNGKHMPWYEKPHKPIVANTNQGIDYTYVQTAEDKENQKRKGPWFDDVDFDETIYDTEDIDLLINDVFMATKQLRAYGPLQTSIINIHSNIQSIKLALRFISRYDSSPYKDTRVQICSHFISIDFNYTIHLHSLIGCEYYTLAVVGLKPDALKFAHFGNVGYIKTYKKLYKVPSLDSTVSIIFGQDLMVYILHANLIRYSPYVVDNRHVRWDLKP